MWNGGSRSAERKGSRTLPEVVAGTHRRSPTGTTSHSEIMRGLVGQPPRVVNPGWAPVLCRGRPAAPPFLQVSLSGGSTHATHTMTPRILCWSRAYRENRCPRIGPADAVADPGTRTDRNRTTMAGFSQLRGGTYPVQKCTTSGADGKLMLPLAASYGTHGQKGVVVCILSPPPHGQKLLAIKG